MTIGNMHLVVQHLYDGTLVISATVNAKHLIAAYHHHGQHFAHMALICRAAAGSKSQPNNKYFNGFNMIEKDNIIVNNNGDRK